MACGLNLVYELYVLSISIVETSMCVYLALQAQWLSGKGESINLQTAAHHYWLAPQVWQMIKSYLNYFIAKWFRFNCKL